MERYLPDRTLGNGCGVNAGSEGAEEEVDAG